MSPTSPTSHETDVAEAWLTVLAYVSRAARAVGTGDWFDVVDKGVPFERAVRSLRDRVLDAEGAGEPLRADAVMAVVREHAVLLAATRALDPEVGACPHGTPLDAPHCQGCDDARDGIALPPETGRLEEDE